MSEAILDSDRTACYNSAVRETQEMKMSRPLTVYSKNGAVVGNYDFEQSAHLLGVGVHDLEWAIEEYGRCDGDHAVALPWGEPFEKFETWAKRYYHGKG